MKISELTKILSGLSEQEKKNKLKRIDDFLSQPAASRSLLADQDCPQGEP